MKNKLLKTIIMLSKCFLYGLVLQTLLLNLVLALNANGQYRNIEEVRVTLSAEQLSLQQFFREVQRQTPFKFSHEYRDVDKQQTVTFAKKEGPVIDFLMEAAQQSQLSFRQVNHGIDVIKKKGSTVEVIAAADPVTISGTVVDENGEPLPGASVTVAGTALGTVTDINGNYSLTVPEEATLIFSYIGFETLEVPVENRSQIDITLTTGSSALDEVVVVGYGTQKKSDLTGSVVRADIESFSDQANTNILQSLQGSVPGLNIGMSTAAGESPSYTIRGQNNLSTANNEPLIVVDGIIYRGNMEDLNPDDIKSVDVLKDASSAAIYGSQAANGVIIITTKTGISDKPQISYSTRLSIREDANPLEYYDRDSYIQLIEDYHWMESRLGPDYTARNPNFDPLDQIYPAEYAGYQAGANVIWNDLITQKGFLQNHNLNISGRSERFNYFVSGSYLGQEEVLVGDKYEKITGKVNLEVNINDWLDIGTNSFITSADHSGVEFPLARRSFSPYSRPFDENGEIIIKPNGGFSDNPYLNENEIDVDKRLQINSVLYANIRIPWIKGLTYRMNYGHSYRTVRHNNFSFIANNFNGRAIKSFDLFYDWTLDNIISYDKTIGEHQINATAVHGREERYGEGTNAIGENYSITTLGFHSLQNAAIRNIESSAFEETNLYTMGRLNYTFKGKYLITGTVRRDGFSGFGENNKIAVFPSIAVGWTLSDESFFSTLTDQVSYFKLRASYGKSGNRGIGRYGTLARVGVRDAYVFGDGGSTLLGQNLSSFAAPDLKWETTIGTNLGFDYEVFNGRISGSFDYYNTNTEDILFVKPLPSIAGLDGVSANIGKVHNKGLEIILNSNNIKNSNMTWTTQFNFSRNTNEIVTILGSDSNGDGREDDLEDAGLFIGQSIGTVFNYEVDGIYQIGEEIPPGFEPGFYRFRDQNGDGTINSNDRVILGREEPAFRFGISNTISIKQLELFFFINSIQGGRDGYLGSHTPWIEFNDARAGRMENNRPMAHEYWSPDNTDGVFPSLRYTSPLNPIVYFQRSFVRLQDVKLSYAFKPELVRKIGINQLRVFVSGRNLLTFTDWVGNDPETGTGFTGRPVIRSYNLGFNLTF